jgi:hypothetical protein
MKQPLFHTRAEQIVWLRQRQAELDVQDKALSKERERAGKVNDKPQSAAKASSRSRRAR